MAPAHLIDWGMAGAALAGEAESGDLSLVKSVGRGALLAVVDGLGHGAEAASAARAAIAALDRYTGDSLLQLVHRSHHSLHGTRGVVMTLAFVDGVDRSLTWLGVGNVAGVLVYADPAARPARASLLTPGGIVGSELPRLHAHVVALTPGDLLVFATDGIQHGFADVVAADAPPQQLADHILAHHRKGTDDALVLVARYVGDPGRGA